MRISDWSSDVCSSDLVVRHPCPFVALVKHRLACGRRASMARAGRNNRSPVKPVIASEAKQSRAACHALDCFVATLLAMTSASVSTDALHRALMRADALVARAEIGRASGRESVCQYV